MKTSKSLTLAVAGGLLAAGTFLTVRGAALAGEPHPLKARLLERAKEKLSLSNDQKSQIKSAVSGERAAVADLHSRMQEAKVGLKQAIRSPGATESSIRAAAGELSEVLADAAVERAKIRNEIGPKLNQVQKDRIEKFQTKRAALRDQIREKIRDRVKER